MADESLPIDEENNEDDQSKTDSAINFFCGVVEGFYGRPWSLEQRKDLFIKLKRFGMNTYMYAPKDDLKHRACWRELYTVEEAEQLSLLIKNAKSNDILFIYAISPGLDIGYSNAKDISALKRKIDQVKNLGCPSFAILFDDIEPELNESDKEVFKSFANAQISVTNDIYQHLGQQNFLFCPTEYCASRAVPNVQHSNYLLTIGSKLSQGIDIMWTGSRVISQNICVAQIQELSEVLHRHPVIWDNLHANDYDQKRLFLGPYSGRSTKLIPYLKGVLTNPNCEYETNYIPIHTLAQWSKCSLDACANICSDVKLESELDNGSIEDIPTEISSTTYHPKNALRISINDWVQEFYKSKSPVIKFGLTNLGQSNPTPANCVAASNFDSIVISNNSNKLKSESIGTSENDSGKFESKDDESFANKIETDSLDLKENNLNQNLEPMDCIPSPEISPKLNSLDVPMFENCVKDEINTPKSMASIDSSEDMQTELSEIDEEAKTNMLVYEDIALLVDLFYLPFEHGPQGVQMLQEFHWLKSNGYIVSEYRRKRTNEIILNSEINEWYERASKFNDITVMIGRLLTRLTFCKNRSLLYDLYSYVWDIKGVISLLNSYVKWIGFSKGYKEAFKSGEQEPWLFRGGLTGELQRLLPVESISDLFLYKAPDSPSSRIYTIRPYLPSDLLSVYEVCFRNYQRHVYLEDQQTLVGDKYVGGLLTLSPEYCFIVEDDVCLCGYALAVLDAKNYYRKCEVSWVPELLKKYPLNKNNQPTKTKYLNEFIEEMHQDLKQKLFDPESIFKNYPSFLNFAVMSNITDLSVPKRMLTCVIAALKANGSKGVYCKIVHRDKKLVDLYIKLGFQVINLNNSTDNDNLYVGRVI